MSIFRLPRCLKRLFRCKPRAGTVSRRNMILAYMPWYLMETEVDFGDYVVSPFYLNRANLPFFLNNETEIKAILINHLERPFTSNDQREFPIKHGSIICKKNENFGYELSPLEQDEIMILQYVLAIAGISNREFLHQNLYLSTENFKIYFQKFQSPITGQFTPAIFTKRKDGFSGIGFSQGLFREVKSWHIPKQELAPNQYYRLHFDLILAQCLWSIFRNTSHSSVWEEHIYPSIFSFYMGNTDGLSYQIEAVYSASAIEKLLIGHRYKLTDLVVEFQNLIRSLNLNIRFPGQTHRNWAQIGYYNGRTRIAAANILEAWLIEFKNLRNNFAHGNVVNRASLVWSIDEHLKISSFFYPLLLKGYIQVNRLCTSCGFALSSTDTNKLEAMGEILEIDNLFEVWDGVNDTNWDRIIKDTHW